MAVSIDSSPLRVRGLMVEPWPEIGLEGDPFDLLLGPDLNEVEETIGYAAGAYGLEDGEDPW